MPCCPNCHVAAVAASHSASAVRDLGFAGAAASALGIGYKRGLFDAPAARFAEGEPTDQSASAAGVEPVRESGDR